VLLTVYVLLQLVRRRPSTIGRPKRRECDARTEVEVHFVVLELRSCLVLLALTHAVLIRKRVTAAFHVAVVSGGVAVVGAPPVERGKVAEDVGKLVALKI
jgi:hypothetical protein